MHDDDDAQNHASDEAEPHRPGPADLAPEVDQTATDPHGVGAVDVPPWPQHPAEWLTQGLAFRWLDFAVYQVEKVFVVAALALMSVMIFLEMFYLALVAEGSRLAAFFVGWYARFSGGEPSEAARLAFEAWVIRGELVVGVLLCYAAVATRLPGRPLWHKLVGTAVTLALLVGYARIVLTQPSAVAYNVLLVAMLAGTAFAAFTTPTGAAAKNNLRRKRLNVFIAIAAASPLLFWVFSTLPDDFSFAQPRALFLLLWVGFVGGSMATYQRSHLRIDFVRKLVKGERASGIYGALSLLVTLMFTAALLYVAYDYVFNAESGMRTTRTAEGAIPDWVKVLAIPITLSVMCLRFARHLVQELMRAARGDAATLTSRATTETAQ